jgi:hypothetical protein
MRRIHEAQVHLINQSAGLKGMARAFVSQVSLRHAVQLVVNHWHEPIERALLAFAPGP